MVAPDHKELVSKAVRANENDGIVLRQARCLDATHIGTNLEILRSGEITPRPAARGTQAPRRAPATYPPRRLPGRSRNIHDIGTICTEVL
jgi:hypothetical protein